MIQKLLIALAIIIGVSTIYLLSSSFLRKGDKMDIVKFMEKNPEKSALTVRYNNEIIAELNGDRKMPLASTVKIIVAFEYAHQISQNNIDPDELISLDDLDMYYVPRSDGGAHPAWLKHVKEKIRDDKISIQEIAKGMILFSSNANTEWLCDRIGIKNINQRIQSLELETHDSLNYLVSALFVGKEAFPDAKRPDLLSQLKNLSPTEYSDYTFTIHKKLKSDLDYKNDVGDLSLNVQKVWSENLTGSTTNTYVEFMKILNTKEGLDERGQKYFDEIMEYVMANPANQSWLKHLGMKGGSTAFVLTKAVYAEDLEGNTLELAYFFNELGIFDQGPLQGAMNAFELAILNDEEFRKTINIKFGK